MEKKIVTYKHGVLFIMLLSASLYVMLSSCVNRNDNIQVTPRIKKEIKIPALNVARPTLSPDGKIISFVDLKSSKTPSQDDSLSQPAEGGIWAYNIDANSLIKLGDKVTLDDEPFASWSPDSTSMVFGSKGEIWIADLRSNKNYILSKPNERRVKTYPGNYENYFHSPSWSPNQEFIAMMNVYDVWLYDIKSKTYKMLYSPPKELRPGGEVLQLPSLVWSHDSQIIAFVREKLVKPSDKPRKQYREGIAAIEIQTETVKEIVGVDENVEYYPVFSPNGKLVAFFSRKDWGLKPSIYIYDMALNKSSKVAECEDECYMLSWSQDGTKLYFATNKAVWSMNVAKSSPKHEQKILIKGMADLTNVFWHPKGDTWYFIKPLEVGKYLFGTLDMNELR